MRSACSNPSAQSTTRRRASRPGATRSPPRTTTSAAARCTTPPTSRRDRTTPRSAWKVGEGAVVDAAKRTVDFKRTVSEPHPRAIVPLNWVRTKDHQSSLYDLGAWVADHGIEATGPNRAGRDLLFDLPPRVGQWLDEELCRPGESDLAAARRLALALDHTTLAIQGPPGSGKTYTGARMICSLLAAGKRVGITGTSHKVIGNLLNAVFKAASRGGRRGPAGPEGRQGRRCSSTSGSPAARTPRMFGPGSTTVGRTWLPERHGCGRRRGWQTRSMCCSWTKPARSRSPTSSRSRGRTDSLVLLGDPQQLDQPLKGSHPEGADRSALAHILGRDATMPPDAGSLPRDHVEASSRPVPVHLGGVLRRPSRAGAGADRPAGRRRDVAGRRHRAAAPRDPDDRRGQRVSRSRRTPSHGSPGPIVDGGGTLGEREGRGAPASAGWTS